MCSAKEPGGQIVQTVDYDWLKNKANRYKPHQPGYAYWNSIADRVGPGGTTQITDVRTDASGGWSEYKNPYAAMERQMERQAAMQAAAMERQAAMQADYMAQMSELQQQALLQQEEAAKAANIESSKSASDFTVANAGDVARKQMLRRGLMSTYTRYNGLNAQAGGAKAAKLGG
ncbi:MAG TPA: hypothetical protein P5204_08790 [Kiritimatiellia bacterium]|nr:hypothetical protein [Kiritimatiellia bacterium]